MPAVGRAQAVVRGGARELGRGRGGGRGGGGKRQNPHRNALPHIQWEQFHGLVEWTYEWNPGENIPFNKLPRPSRVAMMAESLSDHVTLFIPDTLGQSWVTESNR